jgi:hypothetical protein
LIGCGGDTELPVAELTEADEETSASAAYEDDPVPKPSAETTASTGAIAEALVGEEAPYQTVRVAQQSVDEAAVDAVDAYDRALQAFHSAGESAQSGRWSYWDETVAAARSRTKGRSSKAAENPANFDDFALVKQT